VSTTQSPESATYDAADCQYQLDAADHPADNPPMQALGKWFGRAVLAIGIGALAVALYWRFGREETPDRVAELGEQLAKQERESERAFQTYQPKVTGRFDDLSVPADEILHQLPGIVNVEVHSAKGKAKGRLIHIRDWHFVPKPLMVLDQETLRGRELSAREIDTIWEEHLLEIDLVQVEQMAALRCLVKYHGLQRTFAEGLTKEGMEVYRERIRVAKEIEDGLRKQKAEAEALLNGKANEKAISVVNEADRLLAEHKREVLLELGALGRLQVADVLKTVLPLDDPILLDDDSPVRNGNRAVPNVAKRKARNDGHVRAVLGADFALIVLGGSHDLGESMKAVAPDWEYIRVTTRRVKEVAGE